MVDRIVAAPGNWFVLGNFRRVPETGDSAEAKLSFSHKISRSCTFAAILQSLLRRISSSDSAAMMRSYLRRVSRFGDSAALLLAIIIYTASPASAQTKTPAFRVIAFYTAKNDQAHITFVHEANKWFPAQASRYNFQYDSTNNWANLNAAFLKKYDVIIFLDTRPEKDEQRKAFREFVERGGGWLGFHFSAFALNDSDFPQNWDWYHNTFLGCGEFGSNTWRPTSAVLRIEDSRHPAMKGLGEKFTSAPSEWYRWNNDLKKNPDIQILLSVDSGSFPLGTGPKPEEIWHSGYYPIAWTNKKFRMLYMNMGHNDIDYENRTNKQLSSTFGNTAQDKLILNSLFWLGKMRSPL